MNILVLFGSKSDKHIYQPLNDALAKHFTVDFHVLSAHRNPDELDALLKKTKAQAVIAGAGLAAHLPGVVASKIKVPVFGIPVQSVLGGIDALLSIVQMPLGIPVACIGPQKYLSLISLINNLETSCHKNMINFVANINNSSPQLQKEINRGFQFMAEQNIEIVQANQEASTFFNIRFVEKGEDINPDMAGIHVPILSDDEKTNPHSAIKIFDWINQGGLWVGLNNARNAIIFYQQIYNTFHKGV